MIVVTGPTSRIGRALLPQLVDKHAAVRVIARDASNLSGEIRARVEIIEGSHGDAATGDRAFIGSTHLFWLCPANPQAMSVEAGLCRIRTTRSQSDS